MLKLYSKVQKVLEGPKK